MRTKVFRVLAAMIGAGWLLLGVFAIISYWRSQPMRLIGAIAVIGASIYLINYAVTGKGTLFAHRIRRSR